MSDQVAAVEAGGDSLSTAELVEGAPAAPAGTVAWQTGFDRGIARWRTALKPGRRQQVLIESLNEVAAAISSTMSTSEVLDTVVDGAKHLVGSDKAVLCLLALNGDGLVIDESAVFVRGKRSQYPEDWWRQRIREAADSALEQCMPGTRVVDGTRLMTVPVKSRGRPIGILAVMNPISRRFTDDQVALVAVLGAFAGTALENARLHAQSRAALLADERNRIAKEMHDGLSQSLFGTSLELDLCRKRIEDHPAEVAKRLDHVQAVLVRSMSELRRYIHDLRPVNLNSLGLVGAIHLRVGEIGAARGMSVRVYTEGEERPLPPGPEACLYRVALEAIANTAKHADAKRAVVMLKFNATEVRLMVEDDGHGFVLEEDRVGAGPDEGMGLRSMKERVMAEGGRFSITSGPRGTTVQVVLPC